MNFHKLLFTLLIFFITLGCSFATATPNNQATSTAQPSTPVIVMPSATLDSEFPEGCVNLSETTLNIDIFNSLLVVSDFDFPYHYSYFFDPKLNQLLDIENQTKLSLHDITTEVGSINVSPNKKIIQVYITEKNQYILRTVNEVIKTYDAQGQEDWNRGRWLDNERMIYQLWFDAPYGIYTIVIYNPFTGEEKNIQLELPNSYIVMDTGGRVSWVKADIASSLKQVLYNDKDERLVLWDLDNQREIASLPSPIDLIEGTWSPDGTEFAISSPSQTSGKLLASELFTINMDGTVNKLTNFNQTYIFADVGFKPEWSPNGRYLAYWLKVSNVMNPDRDDLQQWLAVTDTTTFSTQIYCLSSKSGAIVWNPDSTQVIINIEVSNGYAKPILVDLTHMTQTTLDTYGLQVIDWMSP